MRKHLTLVVGFLVVFGLSSCTKEYYDIVPNQTFVYTIQPNQWDWDDGVSNQIYYDINLPELTDYYVDQGIVSVSISVDSEVSYNILPATIAGTSYSVNYTTGFVTIYAEDPIFDPDFEVPIPDRTITVKVTLSDSDFIP
ncbi:hypothetical protein GCM10007415_28440 [Parapedobacter pyrenivorans]|uniref:Uncharacterized protein n=1 Tax=Parapedobacter pyrenivorans TaxID=1305674 RepID=A0A917HW49_9SPHI|nr:hypothetical protein [Parapedobacter pyrenivorans]GGG92038.1 hypothetical protein GCM10007415_28440 [Parapedobacter pyrenivorans]